MDKMSVETKRLWGQNIRSDKTSVRQNVRADKTSFGQNVRRKKHPADKTSVGKKHPWGQNIRQGHLYQGLARQFLLIKIY
jgi:hypothetical protein